MVLKTKAVDDGLLLRRFIIFGIAKTGREGLRLFPGHVLRHTGGEGGGIDAPGDVASDADVSHRLPSDRTLKRRAERFEILLIRREVQTLHSPGERKCPVAVETDCSILEKQPAPGGNLAHAFKSGSVSGNGPKPQGLQKALVIDLKTALAVRGQCLDFGREDQAVVSSPPEQRTYPERIADQVQCVFPAIINGNRELAV